MVFLTGASADGTTATPDGEEQASEVKQAVRYIALGKYLEEIAKGLQGGAPGVQEWRTAWLLPALRAGENFRGYTRQVPWKAFTCLNIAR